MKLNVTKEEFIQMNLTMKNKEICKKLHICENTLWRYKKQLGLPNKEKGRPRKEVEFKEG